MAFTRIKAFFQQLLCNTRTGLWIAVAVGIFVAVGAGQKSRADTFQGIAVEVKGTGPAMIFIPGLNSTSATFTETCEAFAATFSCHLLHLPGFADLAPLESAHEQLLPAMRDIIRAYIAAEKLEQPVLVGHSLGGVLSLMLALDNPDLARQVIVIDALPFYPAIQNPALTAAAARPQAEQMRSYMQGLPDEEYRRNAVVTWLA